MSDEEYRIEIAVTIDRGIMREHRIRDIFSDACGTLGENLADAVASAVELALHYNPEEINVFLDALSGHIKR